MRLYHTPSPKKGSQGKRKRNTEKTNTVQILISSLYAHCMQSIFLWRFLIMLELITLLRIIWPKQLLTQAAEHFIKCVYLLSQYTCQHSVPHMHPTVSVWVRGSVSFYRQQIFCSFPCKSITFIFTHTFTCFSPHLKYVMHYQAPNLERNPASLKDNGRELAG